MKTRKYSHEKKGVILHWKRYLTDVTVTPPYSVTVTHVKSPRRYPTTPPVKFTR